MPRIAVTTILLAAFFSLGSRGCFETDAGARCEMASSCDTCTAMSTCGWCTATSTCTSGTASGPSTGSCGGRWAWTTDMCVAPPPPVDAGRRDAGPAMDASSTIDSGPRVDGAAAGTDSGPPIDGPAPHDSGRAGGCTYVHCPDTYTWTWTGSSPVTRAGCCRDYGSLTAGVGCGVDRYGIGACDEAGGESPVDQPVVESPNFIHCNLPTGVMDCPALYIGQGTSGGTTTPVYVEGCCAETSISGATFCGVVGNCGFGPCCGPPAATQTPVR